MAINYTKTNWVNGQAPAISATNLNKIETGLKAACDGVDNMTPAGIVQMFAGTTAPSGWLECNGQAISRTTYATLFQAIGTTYGSGDGSTTFNVPDLQGRFPQGAGTLDGATYTLGDKKSAGLPNITGTLVNDAYYGYTRASGSGAFYSAGSSNWTSGGSLQGSSVTPSAAFDASRSSSIYGSSTTVQPNALVLKYIIYAGV